MEEDRKPSAKPTEEERKRPATTDSEGRLTTTVEETAATTERRRATTPTVKAQAGATATEAKAATTTEAAGGAATDTITIIAPPPEIIAGVSSTLSTAEAAAAVAAVAHPESLPVEAQDDIDGLTEDLEGLLSIVESGEPADSASARLALSALYGAGHHGRVLTREELLSQGFQSSGLYTDQATGLIVGEVLLRDTGRTDSQGQTLFEKWVVPLEGQFDSDSDTDSE